MNNSCFPNTRKLNACTASFINLLTFLIFQYRSYSNVILENEPTFSRSTIATKKKGWKYYFKSLNHCPTIILSFNLSHNDDRLNDQNLSNTLLYRLGKLPGPGESQIVHNMINSLLFEYYWKLLLTRLQERLGIQVYLCLVSIPRLGKTLTRRIYELYSRQDESTIRPEQIPRNFIILGKDWVTTSFSLEVHRTIFYRLIGRWSRFIHPVNPRLYR